MRGGVSVRDEFKTYLFSYNYEGSQWAFEIKARDADDAKARVDRLYYVTYDGELVAKIPAYLGPVARAAVVVRNVLAWLRRQGAGAFR